MQIVLRGETIGCLHCAARADLQSMQESLKSTTEEIIDLGLRDRKKRRTRQAIRAAAIELFAAQGVDNTTVEQIASAADISTRTFFNYFPTKQHAVSLPYGLRNVVQFMDTTDPFPAAASACRGIAAELDADTDERATLLVGIRLCLVEPSLADQAAAQRARWEHLIAHALGDTFAARVAAATATAAMWAGLVEWAMNNGHQHLTDVVSDALRMLED
jgi:AcrR family transcriptional regulator